MSTMEAVNKTMDDNYSKGIKDDHEEGFTSVVYIEDICPTTYDKVFLPIDVNEMDFEEEMVKLEFVNQESTEETWEEDRSELRTHFSHFDPSSDAEAIEESSSELFEHQADGFIITEMNSKMKTVAIPPVKTTAKSQTKSLIKPGINSPSKLATKLPTILPEATTVPSEIQTKDLETNDNNQKMKFCKIQCTICKKWFLNDTIVMHLLTHSGESGIDFYCLICQQSFEDEESLNTHLPVHLNDNSNNIIFRGEEIMQFIEQRKQHTNEVIKFEEETNVEEIEPVGQIEQLEQLEQIEEVIEEVEPEIIVEILKCDICNIFFEDEESMLEHMAKHENNRKSLQNQQMLTTGDDKPFACSICYKSYKRKSELVRHSMTHNDDRLHECKECSLTFKEKSKLNVHMMSHTGDKPHKCYVCDKEYARKSDLKRHSFVHTGYSCDYCDMAFRDRTKLNTHLITHTGGKKTTVIQSDKLQCPLCNKIFKQKATLNSHLLNNHPNEGVFQCDSCLKLFKNESALQKHELCHS